MLRLSKKNRKGAALVEYGLLIAGVALIAAAAVSTFGHKTNDLIAATAAVLPGAHDDDNGPIVSGRIIETSNTNGPGGDAIALDIDGILANAGTERLGNGLGTTGSTNTLADLVVEP
jgi:Flp pilus assembly pilin Flp